MSRVYNGENVEEFIFGEGTTYEESCKKEETEPAAEPEVDEVEEGVTTTDTDESVEEEVTVTDEEMNLFGVIECVDEPEVACYRIALENEQNYNMIMNAMMSREFSVLESTGAEMVYEAADVKKFFEIVKQTVAKWWNKIQGVFKSVIDRISEFVNGDMRFVKKYEKVNIQAPTKTDKKFEGFNFDNTKTPDYLKIAGEVKLSVDLGIKNITTLTGDKAKEYAETFNKDFEDVKNKMRAYACGKQGQVTEDAFDKELKIALFGSEEKVELDLKPFKALLAEIEYGRLAKGQAKQSYKNAESSVKALYKEIKIAESKFTSGYNDGGMKIAKCLTDSINASLRIMSKALSMEVKAIMTNLRQNRAMAAFYVTNQPDAKTIKKESTVAEATNDLGIVLI